MKRLKMIWLFLLTITLGGCYDVSRFENVKVEPFSPSFVFPLLNSTVSFKEFLERSESNTLVDTLPGTTMFFMAFRDTQQLFTAGELFPIVPFSISQSVEIPSGSVPPTFPQGSQIPLSLDYNESISPIEGAELSEVHLVSDTLVISIVNNFYHQVSGTLRIKSLKNSNGVVYVLPFNLAAYSSSITDRRTLEGYIFDLHNEDLGVYNSFDFEVDATITSSGNPSTSGSLDFQIEFQNPQYGLIMGKLNGSYENPYLKYYISVFNLTILADQYFADPSLNLTIQNSFGVPISFGITEFEFSNENAGTSTIISNTGTIDNGLNISEMNSVEAIATPQQEATSNLFILNTSNSNISSAFSLAPSTLSMGTEFILGDNTDAHDQFILSNSSLTLISDIVLPLYGRITTHVLSDTIPNFEWYDINELIGDGEQSDAEVMIRFKFENELPFDLSFQVEFLDENGNVIDQFFGEDESEWFLESAPVGANGETEGATTMYNSIELTKARYEELSQSTSMVIYYRLHTGGDGANVKVLSTNRINIQMSLYTSVSIDLDNL